MTSYVYCTQFSVLSWYKMGHVMQQLRLLACMHVCSAPDDRQMCRVLSIPAYSHKAMQYQLLLCSSMGELGRLWKRRL